MASVFSKITSGEIPCHKIAENEDYLAFLDIAPNTKGHTLCIPKRETDYIFDMNEADFVGLMVFAKKIAKALKEVIPCQRIGIVVAGLEVPHAHVHLIPMESIDDLSFNRKVKLDTNQLAEIAESIRKRL